MIKTTAHGGHIVLTVVLILAGTKILLAQQPTPTPDCRPPDVDVNVPAYKVAHATYTSNPPPETIITISISPKHFVHNDMKALARQLNEDFCYEQRLSVLILDDEAVARNTSPVGGGYGLFALKWRGTYFIDRTTREEYIEFSKKPKRPNNEVKINLGQTTTPNRVRKRRRHARQ